MRLNENQAERARAILRAHAYECKHYTEAVEEWQKEDGRTLYLHLDHSPYAVFVHPDLPTHAFSDVDRVHVSARDPVFSSNLRLYPRQQNTGRRPEHCGHQVLLPEDELKEALSGLLRRLDSLPYPSRR
jgi:hypothetical protein